MSAFTAPQDAAQWQTLATINELLSVSFRYPDKAMVEVIASGEWADAALEIVQVAELPVPEGFAEEAAGLAIAEADDAAIDALLHQLRAEATRLFIGSPDPVVSPYEGVWRAKDDGVQPLLFVNPHSMEVERFMKSCGLGRPEGTNEPLDYVATELEFLQYLASVQAGIVAPAVESVQPADLPGGSAGAAYETFLADHVMTWMPRFAEKVIEDSNAKFYQAAAQLLKVFLA